MKNELMRWSGIAGVLVFLVGTGMAIANYPNYNFFTQYLSELGIGEKSAVWFNTGLISAGMLFAVFLFEFFREHNFNGKKILQVLGILDGLALMGVGIFPMDIEVLHAVMAALFFALAGILVTGYSISVWKSKPVIAVLGILIALEDAVFLIFNEHPILQKVTVGLLLIWVMGATLMARK